ncbi:MAG: hypothetical protein NC041_02340 [Bacteroides sp.]|nr:hypothetical protein [Prevotella sp.]MCM1407558.1 hypothetical protein [Treponema brennaborense]MCM1469292.1 hypothetical protein [Bacteroides sp.]
MTHRSYAENNQGLKMTFFVLICVLHCAAAWAMPGVQDFLPTESGQYVYYRDYTFVAETYIGFLQYDEGTYAARYYAPAAKEGLTDIQILFTLDTSKDYPFFSGEKIINNISADDVTAVNYLHDMLYEFAARRKKMNGSDFSKSIRHTEIYVQFGGEIVITYEFHVPIFNIAKIQDNTGKVLCEAVCINALQDSNDKSFSSFAGFSKVPQENAKSGKQLSRSAEKKLDKKWKSVGDTVWLMGGDALCYIGVQKIDAASFSGAPYTPFDFGVRNFFTTDNGNYSYLPRAKIVRKNNSVIVNNMQYIAASQTWTQDIKILSLMPDGTYRIAGITVYNPFYAANKSYFDDIVSRLTE